MGLSFWKDNDRLLHFKTDGQIEDFFKFGFSRRDYKYGEPDYRHSKKGVISATKWELAETFFGHFSSKHFAELMLQYASEPDNPMEERVAKEVAVLDDFLHYGYAFNIQRLAGKYKFWRIHVPGYSTADLKKIIPNVFQSRTKVQGFGDLYSVSPILVNAKKNSALGKLRKYGDPVLEDQVALHMMGRSSEVSNKDVLQAKLYRRWNHPVLILDNTRDVAWLPTQTNLDYTLEALSADYPKLNGHTYDSRGDKKDFTARYLACG